MTLAISIDLFTYLQKITTKHSVKGKYWFYLVSNLITDSDIIEEAVMDAHEFDILPLN